MRFRVRRISLVAVALVAIVAYVVHLFLEVPFWIAFGFAFLGLLLNVVVATMEDNRPRGPDNPKDPPSEAG